MKNLFDYEKMLHFTRFHSEELNINTTNTHSLTGYRFVQSPYTIKEIEKKTRTQKN